MKKEIRVYVVDTVESSASNIKLDPETEYFKEKLFMDEAETQGSVYTLVGFQNALNRGLYLGRSYVYFKEVECND